MKPPYRLFLSIILGLALGLTVGRYCLGPRPTKVILLIPDDTTGKAIQAEIRR